MTEIAELERTALYGNLVIVFGRVRHASQYNGHLLRARRPGLPRWLLEGRGEKPLEGGGIHGIAQVVALGQVDAELAQVVELVWRFHTLGHDGHAKGVGEFDQAGNDRALAAIGRQPGDEGAVDLDDVEGRAF